MPIMKCSVLSDKMPCTPWKIKFSFMPASCYSCLACSSTWRRHIPPKRRLTFKGLHGVIFEKTELFITTVMRTSDPTYCHVIEWQPLQGPGLFFSSVIIFYTDDRTIWMSDKPVARPLPIHRTTQTQNKCIHRHPCLEWDSNSRSQRSSERRQFMLQTARPLLSASIEHLQIVTTSNYSVTANSHTVQLTIARAKPSGSPVYSPVLAW
jgi:hypothetical protein